MTASRMFSFKKDKSPAQDTPPGTVAAKPGLFARLKSRLARTGSGLTEGLTSLVLGKKKIDAELLDDLETRLLLADVGVDATRQIIDDLTARVARKQLDDADALFAALREDMTAILAPCSRPLELTEGVKPFVILMVGVNGVGKTTTIGKLTKRLQAQSKSVMLAAGDTFRAAAVEQLQVWGERNDVTVITQGSGADSAAVIFDAFQSARARSGPMKSDDEEFIRRARGGDKDAFRRLVETHQDRLFGLVISMVSNREQAEDLLQEIFVKAYFALESFEGQ